MRFTGPITYDLRTEGANVQVIAHVAGHPSEVICGGHFPHQQAREFARAILDLADRAEVAEGIETGGVPRRAARVVLPTISYGLQVQGSA